MRGRGTVPRVVGGGQPAPPPAAGAALEVRRGDDGSVTLLDGDAVVILARPADLHLDVPDPVSPCGGRGCRGRLSLAGAPSLPDMLRLRARAARRRRAAGVSRTGRGPERTVGHAVGPGRLTCRFRRRGRSCFHVLGTRLPQRRGGDGRHRQLQRMSSGGCAAWIELTHPATFGARPPSSAMPRGERPLAR
jgi:hypothetical protein